MNYISIGPLKKKFSAIALGTTYFGTAIEESLAFSLLDAFAENGGTTIDTARVYGQKAAGRRSISEEVVGRWLQAHGMASTMAVVTKGAHPHLKGMKSRISRDEIVSDIEATQKALGLDSLDLWMLHRDDISIHMEQMSQIITEVYETVEVKHIGVSNWTHGRIEQACSLWPQPPIASEIQYSLASTTPERYSDLTLVCMNDEEFTYYREKQLPVFAFSSQAKGFFSKGIEGGIDSLPEKVRSRFVDERNLTMLERVRSVCDQTGYSPAAVSLSSLLNSPFPVVAIIGCSTLPQLRDSLEASMVEVDSTMEKQLLGGVYETA
ncbi:MAG: aldo/keto reductase [Sphaerochaetaceae bacterium]|nr:aldo/keto reductase [Sphaerochaetaceae bacterium]